MYIASIDEYTTIGAAGWAAAHRTGCTARYTPPRVPRGGESSAANLGIYSALAAVFSGK
jgi:hypothetical protein